MLEMDAELEQYILAHSEPEGEVLAELSRATHLNVLRPRMLSGNLQGQFLKMICRMIGARRVLEIGTYTGYAAISMAAGLEKGGVLHTIDVNDELEDFTRQYIEKAACRSVSFFTWGMLARLFPRWMKCLIWCLSMPINGNIRNITAWCLIRFVTGE